MKLLFAMTLMLFLSMTACNSDNDDVICDANGCRNSNQVNNFANGAGGCFINQAGICTSSIIGASCLMNTARQCVPSNQANCTAFDSFGNCISGNGSFGGGFCTFRDRFGNCIPNGCRVYDVWGRCIR